jgi:hypothetical protein|tara:strand:- start:361 stop:492 length:132 start_codon:yes stop_codon:yes gene_type:complete
MDATTIGELLCHPPTTTEENTFSIPQSDSLVEKFERYSEELGE